MSYDEHLISMAGGDGDKLDLDAIQARAEKSADGNFIERARQESRVIHEDVPSLLSLVREQQAAIARGLVLARNLDRLAPGDKHYAGLIRAALTATEGPA